MIRHLNRAQLNTDKYDICVENSLQARIYAHSWYLDKLTNWDALVLDDYKAVMPLPYKQKLCVKYITQPYFTQQLGVFSLQKTDAKLMAEFIKCIPKKFLKIRLQLNSKNVLPPFKTTDIRPNYILDLSPDYSVIRADFSKTRKRRINQVRKSLGSLEMTDDIPFEELIKLTKRYYNFGYSGEVYQKLKGLLLELTRRDRLIIKAIKDKKGNWLGGIIFLKDANRIVYFYSVMTPRARQLHLPSFLINQIIVENAGTNCILDFEGSAIDGIAFFFKSFGAIDEPYYLLKKYNISAKLF